ncbi:MULTISPECIES: GntR family transcriptional regulator [unclassified Streptomyces]|uniref:GntR family transcriptional regulator n=1 Tax=unclassified Streptomyces TaxID=2593676 RepID=UPI0036A46C8D
MSLDPKSGRPLYLQLADVIAARIATGEYAPDRMIPTPARLAEEYGIAVLTARRAMQELRRHELIYTVPGKGSFVAPTAGVSTPATVDNEQARQWLGVALDEARDGLSEGGIPIGAALYGADGTLLGRGRNRRVQDGDPSTHAETAAFRAAGRQRSYRGTTMVTTLSPCWYCSGLVRQFGISRVVVGEAETFHGGHDWLARHGVEVIVLDDPACVALMRDFIAARPALWYEDIGEDTP